MAIVAEFIQRVQSLYSKGVQSDDTRLRSRHIFSKLVSVRNRLTYQKNNKNQKLSNWVFQTLPCVELIKAPLHECPCLPKDGCRILRSKFKLPKPIASLNKDLIKSVTTISGNISFDETSFELVKYQGGNKYTSTKPGWYVKNQYLYITFNQSLEVVTVVGLFENPEEVWNYPSICEDTDCEECDCIPAYEREFHIDSDLVDPMIELSAQELINTFSQMREDLTNDSRDNLVEESKS